MNNKDFFFTSESVTEGHPDKVCDQISDAVLDEVLKQDPKGRVACETFITVGLVIIGGEITTTGYVDIGNMTRALIKEIGYTDAKYGFNYQTCSVLNAIGEQSPDIAQGVDLGGAGDQGLMIGYACNETPELMPMPIMLAHQLTKRLAEVRKTKILPYLGPDGKSQVTVQYQDGKPKRVEAVVISSQHTEEILDKSGKKITQEATQEIKEKVIFAVLDENLRDKNTKYYINPTGKFVVGGPQSDTGMTGRKIIVDTYGGMCPHGGGAFSGKDPTKVDRSASYMARYIAKNIVATGVVEQCSIQLAYAIGVKEPVSIYVDTAGGKEIPNSKLLEMIKKNFELTPQGIMDLLNLRRPIYKKTAAYGHFGRTEVEFTWEKTDKVSDLLKEL
ncbi:MAG: methionine adenosyltransferase [candidate division Zixibacteria bacterium RBG_16_40_9]|nr:MAG: methionine adenosyltransferase [candidate division Zixibacteria bacterium RBG_16_40_9]